MEHVDEQRLENDLAYRFEYLKSFVGFGDSDVASIRSVVAHLAPRVGQLVDRTYEKLLSYDATARHFVPRHHEFDGNVPESLQSLSAQDEQIRFRKDHLQRYFMQLLGHAYNEKMAVYLDMVGKIHTPQAGNHQIDVPLVQMNALMGLIADILNETLLGIDISNEQKQAAVRAFQKLLWIQNDFVTRHYTKQSR